MYEKEIHINTFKQSSRIYKITIARNTIDATQQAHQSYKNSIHGFIWK